jgi:hypothetical protein
MGRASTMAAFRMFRSRVQVTAAHPICAGDALRRLTGQSDNSREQLEIAQNGGRSARLRRNRWRERTRSTGKPAGAAQSRCSTTPAHRKPPRTPARPVSDSSWLRRTRSKRLRPDAPRLRHDRGRVAGEQWLDSAFRRRPRRWFDLLPFAPSGASVLRLRGAHIVQRAYGLASVMCWRSSLRFPRLGSDSDWNADFSVLLPVALSLGMRPHGPSALWCPFPALSSPAGFR